MACRRLIDEKGRQCSCRTGTCSLGVGAQEKAQALEDNRTTWMYRAMAAEARVQELEEELAAALGVDPPDDGGLMSDTPREEAMDGSAHRDVEALLIDITSLPETEYQER